MKSINRLQLRMFFLSLAAMTTWQGCALFGGSDEDPAKKNSQIKFSTPKQPFKEIHVTTADHVWQSEKTGNTIAVNSVCQKYTDVSLKSLQDNILVGIEKLNILESSNIQYDGRDAQRTVAEGKTDGIDVKIDLLIYKKNNCNYDLTYISRKDSFEKERTHFEAFLKGFAAP